MESKFGFSPAEAVLERKMLRGVPVLRIYRKLGGGLATSKAQG